MTTDDFERMGWHDVQIHAMAAINEFPDQLEFLLDIDYILEWVKPEEKGGSFKFWLAPATLVFENVFRLKMDIDAHQPEWQIDEIRREEARTPSGAKGWQWTVDLHEGDITFWSVPGFKQYIRREPILHDHQHLVWENRGGVSFGRVHFPNPRN